jgi:OOP family OmpA-OmpF porin
LGEFYPGFEQRSDVFGWKTKGDISDMTMKALLAATAMIALTACAGQELGKAQKMTPNSTDFDNALAAGYLRLAQAEYSEGDYADADYFARQAMAAGDPQKVMPLPEVSSRKLPQSEAFYVGTAREELDQLFDAGARVKVPQLAATAQVAFECWIQELEENQQPDHIEACRDQLDGLIPAIRNAVAPQAAAAPAPAQKAPAPAQKAKPPKGKLFKVYFATGSARLDDAANKTLSEAVDLAGKFNTLRVVVSGYTDTAGNAAANERLSQRRAQVVAAALRIRGVARDAIKVKGYGEKYLDARTADGVAEGKNRRVEISVAP